MESPQTGPRLYRDGSQKRFYNLIFGYVIPFFIEYCWAKSGIGGKFKKVSVGLHFITSLIGTVKKCNFHFRNLVGIF